MVILLLDKKAFCQTKAKDFKGEVDDEEEGEEFQDDEEQEEDDEEDEDDAIDHDEIILGNTTDVVIALSKALGDQYMTYMGKVGPSLVRYLDDSHPTSDRVMVIGCLAESFNNCPPAIGVYFNDFLQIILKNANTDHSGLNRNAAYAIGILAEFSGVLLGQHLPAVLQALNKMFQASEEPDAKDNVIAATCRVAQNYAANVPFDELTQFIFSNAPLTGDMNENETVLKFAYNLFSLSPEKVQPYMHQVTLTSLKVLIDEKCDEIEDSFKAEVGKFIKNVIMTQNLTLLQEMESKMSEDEK